MPAKRSDTNTVKFSITLSAPLAEVLDQLAEEGIYGSSRAEIVKQFVTERIGKIRESGTLPGG